MPPSDVRSRDRGAIWDLLINHDPSASIALIFCTGGACKVDMSMTRSMVKRRSSDKIVSELFPTGVLADMLLCTKLFSAAGPPGKAW